MSLQELRNLTITKILWIGNLALFLTLSDGQTCKVGHRLDFKGSYSFDPAKKITKVEVIIDKHEDNILRINFYHREERLVFVG